jgi:hypothetical protein
MPLRRSLKGDIADKFVKLFLNTFFFSIVIVDIFIEFRLCPMAGRCANEGTFC